MSTTIDPQLPQNPILIEWSEVFEPSPEFPYSHCVGKTPFGEYLISWEGDKATPCYDIDQTPFADAPNLGSELRLEVSKEKCQTQFNNKTSLIEDYFQCGTCAEYINCGTESQAHDDNCTRGKNE